MRFLLLCVVIVGGSHLYSNGLILYWSMFRGVFFFLLSAGSFDMYDTRTYASTFYCFRTEHNSTDRGNDSVSFHVFSSSCHPLLRSSSLSLIFAHSNARTHIQMINHILFLLLINFNANQCSLITYQCSQYE